jgi:acyl-CoA reductase-like NAD-dependent aldehyde dehydrogenase
LVSIEGDVFRVTTELKALAPLCTQQHVALDYPALPEARSENVHPVYRPTLDQHAFPTSHQTLEPPAILRADPEPLSVDAMAQRAVQAQHAFQGWSEARIDQLLQVLAERVSRHAEELAIAAVQETRLGNVADKTAKNRFASLDVCRSLVGQVGHGRLWWDKRKKVTTFASPVGVVFGLVPATNPTSCIGYLDHPFENSTLRSD